MTTIDQIIDTILQHEGGYTNHPADRGGPTKYGITQGTLEAFRQRHTTEQHVKDLTENEARDIYKKMYYNNPKIYQLPEFIQPLITDMAVNHGPRRAIKILQSTLKDDFFTSPGKIDGIIGPKTLQTVYEVTKRFSKESIIDALVDKRIGFYHAIINRDPSQRVFENGWITRAESFRTVQA